MTPTKRLVFGDDGSEPADVAWQWIVNQTWPGWRIDVLTADQESSSIEWGSPPQPKQWDPPWERDKAVGGSPDLRFQRIATDPRAMLTEETDVDLLVVGLRTHSYLRGMVTGSTTEWLLHHPPSPLVVAATSDPVQQVVACVDGSRHALAALQAFVSLPLAGSTRVSILAVDDGRTDAEGAAREGADTIAPVVEDVRTEVTKGEPTRVILEHLDRQQPQLAVLGTRGLTGWQRLRLGSTASAVVRSAPCASIVASAEMD